MAEDERGTSLVGMPMASFSDPEGDAERGGAAKRIEGVTDRERGRARLWGGDSEGRGVEGERDRRVA
jgi:hypothetical protein